ncbi:hypothetical protein [Rhodococcus erythropolis]|uniref:hypothetical protein n=1 Tax=Rhodococcus erythropolis TaxID=1833 RepID=UPI003082D2EA
MALHRHLRRRQMKVGTAAEFRKHPRVAEQGAVCALFVARSTDGYSIRSLEARVSEHFHLSQAIRTSRKIEALTGPLDREKLRKSLHHFVSSIKDELNDIGSDIDGIEILEAPEEWTAPACADVVFDAAPLIAYPHTFESGEHSLYLEGLAGSIASLRIDPDPESPRFVADVSGLVGRTITVGEFESPGVAIQESLF